MDLIPCEFRKERPIEGDEACRHEIVCQAANFAHLAVAGEDTTYMEDVCGRCPIPDPIANDRWACLHLRPVKMLGENSEVTYFTCRWFYKLQRHGQPTDLTWCHACPHWFPRPPLELIRGHHEETEAIRRYIVEGPPPPKRWWAPVGSRKPGSWWQRLFSWL
jgi:hypothetical protein